MIGLNIRLRLTGKKSSAFTVLEAAVAGCWRATRTCSCCTAAGCRAGAAGCRAGAAGCRAGAAGCRAGAADCRAGAAGCRAGATDAWLRVFDGGVEVRWLFKTTEDFVILTGSGAGPKRYAIKRNTTSNPEHKRRYNGNNFVLMFCSQNYTNIDKCYLHREELGMVLWEESELKTSKMLLCCILKYIVNNHL